MTREQRLAKKAEYKGPRYDVPTGDPGRPCKSCGMNIHWVKTPAGKWMPVEYDGMPHWPFCDEPERFSRR